MEEIMTTFSENLKRERKKTHLSQRDFADKLGMSDSTISRLETEQREPSIQELEIFSKAFNMTIDELLHNDISENRSASITTSPEPQQNDPEINQNTTSKETLKINIIDDFFESKYGKAIYYMIIMMIAIILDIFSIYGLVFSIYALYYALKQKFPKAILLLNVFYILWTILLILEVYCGIFILPSTTGYYEITS